MCDQFVLVFITVHLYAYFNSCLQAL